MSSSGSERRAGAPARGWVAPVVAATLLCALALPLTIALLVQVVAPEHGTAIALRVGLLAGVLHIAGFLCVRFPRTAFAIGALVMLALAATGVAGMSSAALVPSAAVFVLLEWQVASTQDRTTAAAALVVGIAGAGIIAAVDAMTNAASQPLGIVFEGVALAAVVAAGWLLGRDARRRRAAAATWARQQVDDALAAERTRIGRDLHDVVSHGLAVMIAQVEAARVLPPGPPQTAALERVAETGRSAMQGLRGMLRLLDSPDEIEPVAGLPGIAALAEGAASPAHRISFRETGRAGTLAPDAEVALFRAAQEALTNVVRHVEPPLAASVALDWRDDEVVLSVTDDGGTGPRDAGGAGRGLVGMAERVRLAGGTLEIERGQGWSIRITMPLTDET
ncbi:two-component sensor histidine kinase [Microbacterium sp. CFH 90308]|uniref:histidine kinase n=1 Tax=Microbacterium salsuginis TaxID=2722803 RepID=A0ABX1KH63_9MICO|nr:histidine kinase [Microbacterium sp. CFH 90308]NLP85328.1 two-component sensor histidine kinase [Microbacterium sp. CFH 90308]